ncbi:hypothetical protein WME98_04625 [Sorangium sp. So ce296]|uniref:hypothetical protein n=1 Tax=Sorangium sp. So ce296 TaxID=3133296 RepID=UPI003F5DCA99
MLLAEIQGKLKGTFACAACGSSDGVRLEAASAMEDVLTSNVFGALRYLRPELGVLPLLEHLDLRLDPAHSPRLTAWPSNVASIVALGDRELRDVGCEPDVVLEGRAALVLVEVKLGAPLGADPMQLPKESIVAHQRASGRPWRLLCVTPGATAPHLQGFRVEEGRLARGPVVPLAEAVASYFTAATMLRPVADWPRASEVRANVRWMSWSSVGKLLRAAFERNATAPHEENLLADVLALLQMRGLLRPDFHGFTRLEATLFQRLGHPLWRRPRPRARSLWSFACTVTPWPKLRWLASVAGGVGPRGFAALRPRPLASWPGAIWRQRDQRGSVPRRR